MSAKQEDVLAADNALIRQFPARAVEVSNTLMSNSSFLKELCSHINKLSVEVYVPEAMEVVQKARKDIEESRETKHPRLVTEWLFSVLSSTGHATETKAVFKRTHDDVLFRDALAPWRRSSVYQSIKVALQLALFNCPLGDPSHTIYKQLMLYFLSQVSLRLLPTQQPLEYLHVIRAKLARRAAKLTCEMPFFLEEVFKQATSKISADMNKQWSVVQAREAVQIASLPMANNDLNVHLRKSHIQLQKVLVQATDETQHFGEMFQPACSTSFKLNPEVLPFPSMFEKTGGELIERLVVFEAWVQKNLPTWLEVTAPSAFMCEELKALIDRHWNSARSVYSPYAELMSTVLLTTFDLWVALDKQTTALCPLLLRYPPEVPVDVFQPLLLPKRAQIDRLARIEQYIASRRKQSVRTLPSLFGTIASDSFTVRAFESSAKMQELKATIDQEAHVRKEEVRELFYQLKDQFDHLVSKAKLMTCDKWWFREGSKAGTYEHRRNCQKCHQFKTANRMSIKKFEEPLPNFDAAQKAVVFELQPGNEFAPFIAYRDATWIVLHDVLSLSIISGIEAEQKLRDYDFLKNYYSSSAPRRISLASAKKSHALTHRFTSLITTAEEAIFLPHAMEHALYDNARTGVWTKDQKGSLSLARFCHAQLGNSNYSPLIETVRNTTISQNSIIARQSSCPIDLGIHDWVVFGSLRAGPSLQSINLLRTLLAGELDLSCSATVVMVEQILHEAGETRTTTLISLRANHVAFQVTTFVENILHACDVLLSRIASNWKETVTATIVRVITQRVLSLACSSDVVSRCIEIIRRLRKISMEWASRLAKLYAEQRNQGSSKALCEEPRRRILEAAMLARAT